MEAGDGGAQFTVVLDTNVIVAGLRSRNGASFLLLDFVEHQRLSLILSKALVAEYDDVVRRPEHRRVHALSDAQINRFLHGLVVRGRIVETRPDRRIRLSRDPDDAIVAEAAIDGAADYLVTHNIRDFAEIAERVPVVTPAQLLRRMVS